MTVIKPVFLLIVTFVSMLAACTTTTTPPRVFRGPDGGEYIEVNCGGSRQTPADCMNAAYNLCHGSYKVLGGNSEITGSTTTAIKGFATTDVSVQRTLSFRCDKRSMTQVKKDVAVEIRIERCFSKAECVDWLRKHGEECESKPDEWWCSSTD